jgi:nicotinamide riboside kinase
MKVVITGPESSGKSTLFNSLEKHFNIKGVDEYARDFLNVTNGKYVAGDLLTISKGQIKGEMSVKKVNPLFLLCDTDLLTIKIWSNYKFNFCDTQILNLLNNNPADLYLLMSPDIPWEPDPLRENPEDRVEILNLYINELKSLGISYHLIAGSAKERLNQAIKLINSHLSIN